MNDTQRIYHLEEQLAHLGDNNATDIYKKIDILNELAWLLSDTDMKRAYTLAETAYNLANAANGDEPPYQIGIAYSLRTQGYLNVRFDNYPLALTQLLQALPLVETLQLSDGLPDVLDGILGVYFQLGNLPDALSFGYKQLAAAQQIQDQRRIINAYNNLAVIQMRLANHASADEMWQQALQISQKIGHTRIECITYTNLTHLHLLMGNCEKALENALHGLQLSQAHKYELFEIYALHNVGYCHLQLKQTAQALDYLNRALERARALEAKVIEVSILLTLGAAYRERQQFEQAEATGNQALVITQAIGSRQEQFGAHLFLSELYEQVGDFAQALEHFKQHQVVKEQVHNEAADQRLKVLQVVHDTHMAKQEAEIARLRTVELQQEIIQHTQLNEQLEHQVTERTAELQKSVERLRTEIKERERAETALQAMMTSLEQRLADRTQELATFLDLTVMGGRSANIQDVIEAALPRILEVTNSRAVCIHLFDADTQQLLLVAQQELSFHSRTLLQKVTLPPLFRAWLEQPNEPILTTNLSQSEILPPVFQLAEFNTYLGVQISVGPQIEGILSCYRFTNRGFSLDDIALVMALGEQIGMVIGSHRLRKQAEEFAVLEERQRFARDLHDSVTQSLYSLSLFSRAGREAVEDGDTTRLQYSFSQAETTTLHILREMRLLLYQLRPTNLEREGLQRAIELRLDSVERRVGLHVEAQLDELPALSPNTEVDLYHIIVEALNNIIKHAAATSLTVQLTQKNGHLHLQIVDNGQGFDSSKSTGGLGLTNIQERVNRLNGTLAIVSKPKHGTTVKLEIPY
jgi:signal transduction histidine kinase